MKQKYFFIGFLCLGFVLFIGCNKNVDPPVLESIEPSFGAAGTLIVFKGGNMAGLKELRFGDVEANFNTAYNSDSALLFRVPESLPLGDHIVSYTTEGGTAMGEFRVTLEPPEVFGIEPEFASPGDVVTIKGKNFFDPIEVYFFDSIRAEVISFAPDSILAIVPTGVEKGRITVNANGGGGLSPINFFTVNPIIVNDFDGNGLRAETDKWIFRGAIDQNRNNAIQNRNPDPIDGNFLKLSGQDDLNISWIGGAENHSYDVDDFNTFGITTDVNNTLIEMDINNNGRKKTHIILVLLERDGSPNDFTEQLKIDGTGWSRISVPLNRFKDIGDQNVDPTKVRTLKIHLIDEDDANEKLEINVDNIRFIEIL